MSLKIHQVFDKSLYICTQVTKNNVLNKIQVLNHRGPCLLQYFCFISPMDAWNNSEILNLAPLFLFLLLELPQYSIMCQEYVIHSDCVTNTWFIWGLHYLHTSMTVPLVMTPNDVYMGELGFFFTPMMGRQNVAFSSGCVTWAFLKRSACSQKNTVQLQFYNKNKSQTNWQNNHISFN